jgi:hypothetical protein
MLAFIHSAKVIIESMTHTMALSVTDVNMDPSVL